MADSRQRGLKGCRLLLVEDEYLIAADLAASLESFGIEVIGPAASVEEALLLVENDGARLDGAVLDINLRNERVYPVADVLKALGVPFVFTTGYDSIAVTGPHAGAPRCEKPVDKVQLLRRIAEMLDLSVAIGD